MPKASLHFSDFQNHLRDSNAGRVVHQAGLSSTRATCTSDAYHRVNSRFAKSSHGGAARENEVGLKRDEFLREAFHQLDVTGRPANIDFDVAALDPPELPKLLPKRRQRGLPVLIALDGGRQDTDPAHPFGLLRMGRN